MTRTSTTTTPRTERFRIPAADVRGLWGAAYQVYSRRRYGEVLDGLLVMWHHRPILRSRVALERRVERWNTLDPQLRTLAVMASAARIGCSWCLDFGYFTAHCEGLDEDKVREVPRWREADCFTEVERAVMEYAEAVTATPPEVSDAQVAELIDRLGIPAVVELTELIALENLRSRFNAAAGLTSQGFSEVCARPLAVPSSP